MEEDMSSEIKERLEEVSELSKDWNKYLPITTAIIAVVAAIASLLSGNYSNSAILEKNNAILYQNKASDQWNFYQAKGIKKNLAESFYEQSNSQNLKQQAERYSKEQGEIKKQADEYQNKVKEANERSEKQLGRHHKSAIAVTFFQIAIALSAISALLRKRFFWFMSLFLTFFGLTFLITALLKI